MFDRIMAACLQQVIETDDVGFDIDIRVIYAIADTRLGSEIDHDVKVVLLEELINKLFITDAALHEHMLDRGFGCNGVDLFQPPLLKTHLIVVVHVVERNDGSGGEGLKKPYYKISSNEAGRAGYKDGFIVEVYRLFHIVVPFPVIKKA